jgi:hypothetical protein
MVGKRKGYIQPSFCSPMAGSVISCPIRAYTALATAHDVDILRASDCRVRMHYLNGKLQN